MLHALTGLASRLAERPRAESPELGVILPTFNERGNVLPMLEALRLTLGDIPYEVILGVFYLACSIGLFANLRLANDLLHTGFNPVLAVLAGVAVGSLWNYFMSSMFVWQIQRWVRVTGLRTK